MTTIKCQFPLQSTLRLHWAVTERNGAHTLMMLISCDLLSLTSWGSAGCRTLLGSHTEERSLPALTEAWAEIWDPVCVGGLLELLNVFQLVCITFEHICHPRSLQAWMNFDFRVWPFNYRAARKHSAAPGSAALLLSLHWNKTSLSWAPRSKVKRLSMQREDRGLRGNVELVVCLLRDDDAFLSKSVSRNVSLNYICTMKPKLCTFCRNS